MKVPDEVVGEGDGVARKKLRGGESPGSGGWLSFRSTLSWMNARGLPVRVGRRPW